MKNKLTRSLPVMLAAFLCMGGFSVTAYAQTPEETPPAETAAPEPTPEPQPLTPEGNATLVDDFGGDKQLITVTTKSGNYFYILVDRAAEVENTVHFLNQVDEADLMALMEDGDGKTETPPAVCNCTEKCQTGNVNLSCPLCKTDTSGCTGKEAVTEPEEEKPEAKGNPAAMLLVVLLVAGIGGGAFYYFKVMKPKQNVKGNTDLEDFDFDEYGEDEQPEADTEESPSGQEDETEDTL
ncbi:DUF4366 domain-containing protein [Clostridioides difficile]|uniref:DUF4366 domain-containing protein n=1 Tax=Clostridioides difficile TaxID=1496 RepID=UPI00093C6C62|nr:DUF4366 domain-containing protein [Clostridioides difficile]EGT5471844.1 DUF4366 domain-containing protein [Clostridioides difficile]ELX4588781.1 DUF4366 domain-containing protein [Clostridioides difficile]MBG0254759.1 DUF4366 domain-containing protein [Clostridioides difficile]MBH7535888.1 DUF4366 domain-containing protein [Clostridioides difficile]MBH7846409.1 DUF4366 domain-containing protein [Clostridioides difficile]